MSNTLIDSENSKLKTPNDKMFKFGCLLTIGILVLVTSLSLFVIYWMLKSYHILVN